MVYIYGAYKGGKELYLKLKNYYSIAVDGFMDTYKSGTYENVSIVDAENVDKDSTIIISVMAYYKVVEIVEILKKSGFDTIYWYHRNQGKFIEGSDFFREECTYCGDWGDCVIPHIEYHIVDNCNLNCAGCTHFSPLFNGTDESVSDKLKNIDKLLLKFTDIAGIDILGGEPLLSEDLETYIVELRKKLPNAYIDIFTNGLLIPSLKESTLECIRENNIFFSISEYKPTHNMIDKIIKTLEDANIRYFTTGYDSRNLFNLPISVNESSKYPQKCISKGCHTVTNGKIATCPTLMYVDKFNQEYRQNLPMQGIIDLDCEMTGKEILDELKKDVPLCKHCIELPMEWHRFDKRDGIKNFATFE